MLATPSRRSGVVKAPSEQRVFVLQGLVESILENYQLQVTDSGKKTNRHKHFGRDGVPDKQESSLGQTGPFPETNWDPSLTQTGLFLFNSTVKSRFCSVCPWDGWGFVPGTIAPQGPSEESLCVFLGQKSCRTKVSRIFRFFVPNFAPNFAPNFPRMF